MNHALTVTHDGTLKVVLPKGYEVNKVVVEAGKDKKEFCLSVQPKTGKWIPQEKGLKVTSYRCSECGRIVMDDTGYDVSADYPFCHCGAKMEVEQDG